MNIKNIRKNRDIGSELDKNQGGKRTRIENIV